MFASGGLCKSSQSLYKYIAIFCAKFSDFLGFAEFRGRNENSTVVQFSVSEENFHPGYYVIDHYGRGDDMKGLIPWC